MLGSSKNINGKDKRSHKETVQQEKMKPSRVEKRKQHVVGSQKYPFETIFKEAEPEKIWTF